MESDISLLNDSTTPDDHIRRRSAFLFFLTPSALHPHQAKPFSSFRSLRHLSLLSENIKSLVDRGKRCPLQVRIAKPGHSITSMKIATFTIAILAVACTAILAAPVSQKRGILDVYISKAKGLKKNGAVEVKPTRVSI
ncbi:hypothetical protein EC968_005878 [Mortierella alpina]|nr:hypothetical protein EC968_005878 [Mortierella alpina]